MADNVTVNTGSGATVATDDVSGVHFQKVKIDGGGDGLSAPIGGDASNGLDVDVTRLPSGTVAGSSSLPAGTNNIGDVDVLSIAAGDNNIGNVDIVTMPNVTIGTMANLTESLVDDAAFTPATSRVIPFGATLDDTTPDIVNEGDIGALRMTADRAMHTSIRDSAGNNRGANVNVSNQLEVSVGNTPNVAVTSIAAGDNNIGNVDLASAIPAGTNNIGDVDVLTLPNVTNAGTFAVQESGAALTALQLIDDTVYTDGTGTPSKAIGVAGTDGTNPQIIKTDTSGELQVDVLTLPNVTVGAALPAGDNNIGNVDIVTMPGVAGDVAHDGVDSGNPVKVGAKAVAHGANPTAVAASDRTDLYANRHGIQFVLGGHPNIITLEAAYTAAQTDAAIVTVGAGTKIVVTQIQMTADNANTVDVGFRVGFAAATTPTTTGVVLTHPGVAAGSGVSRGDGSGILGIGADGEDLRITSEVPTSGSIRILVSYFTIES